MIEEEPPDEQCPEPPAAESPAQDASREPAPPDQPTEESHAGETAAAAAPPVAEEPIAAEEPPAVAGEPPVAEGPPAAEEPPAVEEAPVAQAPPAVEEPVAAEPPSAPPREEPAAERAKPAIPGADLEVDIVPEGSDPLAREQALAEFEEDVLDLEPAPEEAPPPAEAALPKATIDLASDARYIATGKRKTAVARVILKPGSGEYTINGKDLNHHFPRPTAQRNIRQPLETVGYESRMDVVAKLHGGGISAQAGALRHGIARALIEADPNLRSELKRRGFLTRDSRAKERRKAGLKKARKKPQFSKR